MYPRFLSRFSWFWLDRYQKLALAWAGGVILGGIILFYPLRQVFAGNWIVRQQLEIPLSFLPGFEVFNYPSLIVRYYALCLLAGILSGYVLALYLAKRRRIGGTVIDRLLIGLAVVGLFGARVFYALFNFNSFVQNPGLLLRINEGGLAFFGMFLAGTAFLYFYCRRYKFNFFEFGDILAPSLLLGQIFGRFGNFFNYEAYGGPTSVFWKMYVPDVVNFYDSLNQKFFHPTFLYEIIPNCLLLFILLWYYARLTKKRAGLVFALYLSGYGMIRFGTEFFRLDALTVSLPARWQSEIFGILVDRVKVSQLLATVIFGVGVWLYLARRKVVYLQRQPVTTLTTASQSKIVF